MYENLSSRRTSESTVDIGQNGNGQDKIIGLKGMYEDYFLDNASYVILERAVPSIFDGLKPVQRRILHAMKTTDDGRYHKVANIIGNTLQYQPHGDALVNLGQKDLMIDCQGNWGDTRPGSCFPLYRGATDQICAGSSL
jgi:topoisomerase-4 subunit A